MKSTSEITGRLRQHLVGAIHTGQLHPGDRLPSLREISRHFAINPRTAASVYRTLADEGLVVVRGRSGVYVALPADRPQMEATSSWVSGVLLQAWERGIYPAQVPAFLASAVGNRQLRCGLVEDVADATEAFRWELEQWGFSVRHLSPKSLHRSSTERRTTDYVSRLLSECSDIDVFVTSAFNVAVAHEVSQLIGKELITVTIHPVYQETLQRMFGNSSLTVICVDPEFEERLRLAYDVDSRVRFVLATDSDAVAAIDPARPVFATLAAGQFESVNRLSGTVHSGPMLSSDTAAALAAAIVRLNGLPLAPPQKWP